LGVAKVVVDAPRCNVWRVNAEAGPTEADKQLIAELADRGLHAAPAQFQRWRKAGLLDPPERPGAGRGKGRPSVCYPPSAVEQATAILKLLDRWVPLKEMALAMFLDRVPVSEASVREAIQYILVDSNSVGLDEEVRADLADQGVNKVRHRVRRVPVLQNLSKKSRQAGGRGTFEDLVTAIVHAAAVGTSPSDEAVADTARVFDISIGEGAAVYRYFNELPPEKAQKTAATISLQEIRAAQFFVENLPPEVIQPEEGRNYRFYSFMVLSFVIFIRSVNTDADLTTVATS
jgi:hypothetical protein